MKILIITQKVDRDDSLLGFFHYWIEHIAALADQVTVIGLAKGTYDLPKNVTVYSLGKEHGAPKMLQALRFYWYAWRSLRTVDGVFVHMAPEYVRALYPLNIFFRKPIVMWYAHIKVSQTAKWAIDHVNYILTPSKESFEYDSPKVIATGHGINTDLFAPRQADVTADLISISRISKVKRIEVLIEALRILKARSLRVTVDIFGAPARPEDQAYKSSLISLAERYGVQEQIHWKGTVANREAPAVYAAHRIFVRLQGGGGFGKTELEAMSMGIPIIVPTDVYTQSLGEFAEDTYFTEDDAEALAERIETMLAWSEDKQHSYATLARSLVVHKHNISHVAEAVVDNLQRVMISSHH